MGRILVTGGAGFVGSHLMDALAETWPQHRLIALDKMTYAADRSNIGPLLASGRAELVVGDVCDFDLCRALVQDCDLVVHAAAESHVDRSFHSSVLFTQTNALGTHTVMEACREAGVPRIIHVSTDEVYGETLSGDRDENAGMNPTNPYAASKAAAEMIVNGYRHSFRLPVIVVRANNMYGTRQFPEKLIPHCIMSLLSGEKIQLHGDGSHQRHYLAAQDFAQALVLLARHGDPGTIYNIGSSEEYRNTQVARMICETLGADFENQVTFVQNRPFNDRRYSLSWDRIAALGWSPHHNLRRDLPELAAWYRDNLDALRARQDLLT